MGKGGGGGRGTKRRKKAPTRYSVRERDRPSQSLLEPLPKSPPSPLARSLLFPFLPRPLRNFVYIYSGLISFRGESKREGKKSTKSWADQGVHPLLFFFSSSFFNVVSSAALKSRYMPCLFFKCQVCWKSEDFFGVNLIALSCIILRLIIPYRKLH